MSKSPDKKGRELAKEKAKAGAPTKYRPEYCQLLIEHMAQGFSFHSFAAVVDVCYDTLHEWEKDFAEFSDAKGRAKAKMLLWDEKILNKGVEGKQRGYNAAAHKWKMTNTHGWKDKVETTERRPGDKSDEELIRDTEKLLNEFKGNIKP